MSDNEFRLEKEVHELKAEVKRLRRMIEGAYVVIGLAAVIIFPQFLWYVVGIVGAIFFACLVSPVRHLIFSSVFQKRD